jgi:lactoylglutathione lyase
MKPTILGLRTTIYKVPDLEAAKAWYNKAFRSEPYYDSIYYIGYNIGGYELGLHPYEGKEVPLGENVFSYWGVGDIQVEYAHFINLGATEFEPITNVGGDIELACVKDPWGNLVGLIYNPAFKTS